MSTSSAPRVSHLLEEHVETIACVQRRVRAADAAAYDAWRAVATSLPRIARRRAICGGSDDDHLRKTIRARLADESLPRVDGRAWAGKGSGAQTCACCGEPIRRVDQEFQPTAAAGLHAHGPCFTIWLAESIGLRMYARDGSAREVNPS